MLLDSVLLFSPFSQMVGIEYILLHAQEPILFIIRKQQRQSPTQGKDVHSVHLGNKEQKRIGTFPYIYLVSKGPSRAQLVACSQCSYR